MHRGFRLSHEDIEILSPIMQGIIWVLETGEHDDVDLGVINLGPGQFVQLLEYLGYEKDDNWETNGWEQDTWLDFHQEGHLSLNFYYCGYTGEMLLRIAD